MKNYNEKKLEDNDPEYFNKPNNLRELIQPEHLNSLLLQYLKSMQNEAIIIQLHPLCAKYLDSLECSYEDLSGLSDDELVKFKQMFKENRTMSQKNIKGEWILSLYDFMIDVLARKTISENSSVKVE